MVWTCALAAFAQPEPVSLSAMTELDDEVVVDRDFLGQSVAQLVRELGTAVARQPGPATTPGASGWEVALSMAYVATEARFRAGEPSPWTQAHPAEDNAPWIGIPRLSIRKGLPFSTEVGAHAGWIAGSGSGSAGVWGRVALLEGFRRSPDVALHLGYTGYVGNPELDVGVLEAGATLSGRRGLGSVAMVHTGHVLPWIDITVLRTTASGQVSNAVRESLGLDGVVASSVVRFAAGFQIRSGPVFFDVSASWSPSTIPVATTGLGVAL